MNKPIRTNVMTVPTTFQPSPQHLRAYRNALGQFATGITVVTAMSDQGPTGMTANSFTSVSLEPPLVLWCLSKKSQRCAVFRAANRFAISVLRENQFDLAMAFAKDGDHFTSSNSVMGETGLPLLRDALASFECTLENVMDAGDHTVQLGRVDSVTFAGGDPLIFHSGHFGSFSG